MVLPSAREAGGDTSVSQPQWRMAGKLSGGESRPSGTKEYIITIIMPGGGGGSDFAESARDPVEGCSTQVQFVCHPN